LAAGCFPYQAAAAEESAPLSEVMRQKYASEGSALQLGAEAPVSETQGPAPYAPLRANFANEQASPEARHIADWAVHSGDNQSLPFVIIDKTDAKVFVFDAYGRLTGAAPALLGLARGDHTLPGIGDLPLSRIRPEDRTTPAGRFVADLGRNHRGKAILWVDYATSLSMHPVITTRPADRRAERLASATPLDNRISFGCVNVPVHFFANVVRPAFTGTNGIVYILPETRTAREVFASYDVDERLQLEHVSRTDPAQTLPLGVESGEHNAAAPR
jgi:hypothetical protein